MTAEGQENVRGDEVVKERTGEGEGARQVDPFVCTCLAHGSPTDVASASLVLPAARAGTDY